MIQTKCGLLCEAISDLNSFHLFLNDVNCGSKFMDQYIKMLSIYYLNQKTEDKVNTLSCYFVGTLRKVP